MTQPREPERMDPHEPRTPEQHAAVRRRALPVAIAGLLLGLAGAVWPLSVQVAAFSPPNIYAVNMAFCAILIGTGMLFYAKGTPGTRTAAVVSVLAIGLGLAGSLVYTKQAIDSRSAREGQELQNVRAVAVAAGAYAEAHGGAYPPDLLAMLEEKTLDPAALQSPYGKRDPLFNNLAKATGTPRPTLLTAVETASDYLYLGSDLKDVPAALAPDILVAASTTTVMRESYAVAFADKKARFITLEEAPKVMAACNAARVKMGLGTLRPPAIIQAAIDEAKAGTRPE